MSVFFISDLHLGHANIIRYCNRPFKEWQRVIEMQNNKCNDCGRKFSSALKPTCDHILPVVYGGGLTFGNVQALCHSCNCKKNKTVSFMRAIDTLLIVESIC